MVRMLGGCCECWEGCFLDCFWWELLCIYLCVLLSVYVFVILFNVERKFVFIYDFFIIKRCVSGLKIKRLVGWGLVE